MHAKYKELLARALQEREEEQNNGLRSVSGVYDLAEGIDGKLYRVPVDSVPNPLMRAPLPARFWALARLTSEEVVQKVLSISPRIRVFIDFVEDLATLSKCTDKKVAAIIIDKKATQIFSIGVNGGPKRGTDCLCKMGGKYTCAHAEANALAKCTVDCTGKTMICSLAPCITCATLMVNVGIDRVYVLHKNGHDEGIELLKIAGVEVINYDPS